MTKQIATNAPRPQDARSHLRHAPGTLTAILVGLGSMLGAGVFVAIGLSSQIAGNAVVVAIGISALVAICNGLSVAHLANGNANSRVVHGGPYEYGAKYLNSHLSFTAAWMFLCAKSASAATAALAISGYALSAFGVTDEFWRVGLGLVAVVTLVGILLGVDMPWSRLSMLTQLGVAGVALLAILLFIVGGLPHFLQPSIGHNLREMGASLFAPAAGGISPLRSVLHAAALMCVAYVGYGQIAMLSTELPRPARTIPRAMVSAILIALLLYLAVTLIAGAAVGFDDLGQITHDTWAPLEVIATGYAMPGGALIIAIGAIIAMLGILFNLIQAMARLMLIMGRRKDMPNPVARVSKTTHTPETAVLGVGILISLAVLIGDIRITWSLSAFTVLIYYALVNLAVVNLTLANAVAINKAAAKSRVTGEPDPVNQRIALPSDTANRFTQMIATLGLLSCLFLAFWVDPGIWLFGLALILIGHGWRWIMRRL